MKQKDSISRSTMSGATIIRRVSTHSKTKKAGTYSARFFLSRIYAERQRQHLSSCAGNDFLEVCHEPIAEVFGEEEFHAVGP